MCMRKAGEAGGRVSAGRVAGRALFGAGAMAFALGVGTALGSWAAEIAGLDGFVGNVIPALLVTVLAVPVVLVAWRRQYGSFAGLGVASPGRAVVGFVTGVAVTGLAAVVTMAAGVAIGWIEWADLDVATLGAFLVTNTVLALLLEAVPEELTLRGYVWGNLRKRYRPLLSAFFVTVLFLLVPGLSTVFGGLTRLVLGQGLGYVGFVPEGQDAFVYPLLLLMFSALLITARVALGTVWTSVGAHLVFLTVNRLMLEGDARETGWTVQAVSLDALLLIPAYIVLGTALFLVVRGIHLMRIGRAGRG